jgi:hypothetical protein
VQVIRAHKQIEADIYCIRFRRDVVFKAAFYEAASKVLAPEKIELSDGRLYLEVHGTTQENAKEFHDAGLFVGQPFRRSLPQKKCLTRN